MLWELLCESVLKFSASVGRNPILIEFCLAKIWIFHIYWYYFNAPGNSRVNNAFHSPVARCINKMSQKHWKIFAVQLGYEDAIFAQRFRKYWYNFAKRSTSFTRKSFLMLRPFHHSVILVHRLFEVCQLTWWRYYLKWSQTNWKVFKHLIYFLANVNFGIESCEKIWQPRPVVSIKLISVSLMCGLSYHAKSLQLQDRESFHCLVKWWEFIEFCFQRSPFRTWSCNRKHIFPSFVSTYRWMVCC